MTEQINMQPDREKIAQLRHAIFYSYNESGDKVAVSLIHIHKIDDNGNIWFHIGRLPLFTDRTEYAGELFFYKKGLHYSTTCYGTGSIETFNSLLLKFKVSFVETNYYEEPVSAKDHIKRSLVRYLSSFHYPVRNLKLG